MPTHLFTVENHRQLPLGLALLPGIPAELLNQPEVKAIEQQTIIQLKLPDGRCRQTVIQNYCVQVPADKEGSLELESLPIPIIVPDGMLEEHIPVGTEVWLP